LGVPRDFVDANTFFGVGFLAVFVVAVVGLVRLPGFKTKNRVAVFVVFRAEYDRMEAAASAALPAILERLGDAGARRELLAGTPAWLWPVSPLMRLMETLGSYATRGFVPRKVFYGLWSPVAVRWWRACAPIVAVMRRRGGPALFEYWEGLVVASERRREEVVDPWAVEDGVAAPDDA